MALTPVMAFSVISCDDVPSVIFDSVSPNIEPVIVPAVGFPTSILLFKVNTLLFPIFPTVSTPPFVTFTFISPVLNTRVLAPLLFPIEYTADASVVLFPLNWTVPTVALKSIFPSKV